MYKRRKNITKSTYTIVFLIAFFCLPVAVTLGAVYQNINSGTDQTQNPTSTNFEAGEVLWVNNVLQVRTRANGTGTVRPLQLTTGANTGIYVGTNGNVGIGTTTITNALTVVGNIVASGSVTGTGGITGNVTAAQVGGGSVFGLTAGKGNYTFQAAASTSPVLFVDATNERVGIGTGSPGYKLDVNGDIRTIGDVYVNGSDILLSQNGNGYATVGLQGTASGLYVGVNLKNDGAKEADASVAWRSLYINTADNYQIQRSAAGTASWTTPFMISSSSNIGIGTANPTQKLDVAGNIRVTSGGLVNSSFGGYIGFASGQDASYYFPSGAAGNTIFRINGATSQAGSYFKINSAAVNTGDIFEINGSGNASLGYPSYSGAAKLAINGNVGIGTTAPLGKLDVRPDGSWLTTEAFVFTQTGNDPELRFYRPSGDGINSISTNIKTTIVSGNPRIDILTGVTAVPGAETFTPRLSILGSSGNVGIGTTTPAYPLTVNGTIASLTGGFRFPDATTQTTAYLGSSQTVSAGNVSQGVFGYPSASSAYAFPAALAVGTTTYAGLPTSGLYVNGNVGIGTMSPGAKLHIEGNTYINQTVNTSFSPNLLIQRTTSAGDYLALLGIGSPDWSFGRDSGGSAFSSRYAVWDLTDNRWESNYNGSVVGPSLVSYDYNGNIRFQTSAPATLVAGDPLSFNDTLTLLGNGNVGIGTTNPLQKLHVYGGNITVDGGGGSGEGAVTAQGQLDLSSGGSNKDVSIKSTGSGSVVFNYNNSSTGNLDLYGGGTTKVFNVSNTGQGYFAGNVGIGTTAPVSKLSVVGTGSFHSNSTSTNYQSQIRVGWGDSWYGGNIFAKSNINLNLATGFYQYYSASAGGDRYRSVNNDGTDRSGASIQLSGYGEVPTSKRIIFYKSAPIANNTDFVSLNEMGAWQENGLYVNGSVGIGTTTPSQVLSVQGNILATGNIISGGTMTANVGAQNVSAGTFGTTAGKGNYTFEAAANTNNVLKVDATNERVGVGTAAPDVPLEVYHVPAVNNTYDDVFKITSKYPTAAADGFGPAVVFSGSINDAQERLLGRIATVKEGTTNTAGMAFSTQTTADTVTEKMRILANGNVGIGATAPGSILDIQKAGTASDQAIITLGGGSTGQAFTRYQQGASTGMAVGYIAGTDSTTRQFRITASAGDLSTNSLLTVQQGGNVGIGTTTPASKLHVVGDVDIRSGGLKMFNGSYGLSAVDGTLLKINQGGFNNTAFINGNVGVGTESPGYKLDVAGDINTTGYIYQSGSLLSSMGAWTIVPTTPDWYTVGYLSTGRGYGEFTVENITSSQHQIIKFLASIQYGGGGQITVLQNSVFATTPFSKIRLARLSADVTYGAYAVQVYGADLYGNATTNRVRLANTGNQGWAIKNFTTVENASYVATTVEVTLVNSTINHSGNLVVNGSVTANGGFTGTMAGALSAAYVSGGAVFGTGSGASKGNYTFQAAANTNPVLFVDATNERVGIGTSGPTSKLHISGAGNQYIRLDDTTSGNTAFFGIWSGTTSVQAGSSNDITLYAGGERMRITNLGNVGIGITAPQERLHIGGDPTDSNQPTSITNSVNDTHTGLFINGGGNAINEKYGIQFGNYLQYGFAGIYSTMSSTSGATKGDLTFDLKNDINDVRLTERMRITSNGNVGIGTTAPDGRLSIEKATATSGTISSTADFMDLYLNDDSETAGEGSAIIFSSKYTLAGNHNKTIRAAIRGGTEAAGANAAGFLAFYTNIPSPANSAPERMRITSDGNVGIGTTSPDAKLYINGANSGYARIAFPSGSDYDGYYFYSSDVATQFGGPALLSLNPEEGFSVSQGVGNINISGGGGNYISIASGQKSFSLDSTNGFSFDGGNIGVGASPSSTYKLYVAGGAKFDNPIEVGSPTAVNHAATKSYVDSLLGTGGSGTSTASFGTIYVAGTSTLAATGGRVNIGANLPAVPSKVNIDGSLQVIGTMSATAFYDYDNTSYYINPNSSNIGFKTLGSVQSDGAIDNNYFMANTLIGTATNPGTYKFAVSGTSYFSGISYFNSQINVAAGQQLVFAASSTNSIVMGGGNISSVGKLTVTTIDPLYEIDGEKYATYASSVAGGVKEEYIGRAKLEPIMMNDEFRMTNEKEFKIQNSKLNHYSYTIDFSKVEKGSDLWVWYQAIDFSRDNVEVMATAYGIPVAIAYEIKEKKIIFRAMMNDEFRMTNEEKRTESTISNEILRSAQNDGEGIEFSFRLVGKRHDWKKWPTYSKDQAEKPSFILKSK